MTEQEDLHSRTLIAAPGLDRGPFSAPKSRLTSSDASVLDGTDGAEITLDRGAVTIGRGEENQFVLKVDGVSRKHARVFPLESCWYIEDTGSTNGIRVNGEAVDRVILNDGDTVEIGPVLYTFSIDAKPVQSAEKTTIEFARGIPTYDPKRRPGNPDPSVGSDALIWSILVIGASAIMFAVFAVAFA